MLEGVLVVQRDPQVVPIVHKVVLGFAGHGDPRRTCSSRGCRKGRARPRGGSPEAGGARRRGTGGRGVAARRPRAGTRAVLRAERTRAARGRCGRANAARAEGGGERSAASGGARPGRDWARRRPRAVARTARDEEEKAAAVARRRRSGEPVTETPELCQPAAPPAGRAREGSAPELRPRPCPP